MCAVSESASRIDLFQINFQSVPTRRIAQREALLMWWLAETDILNLFRFAVKEAKQRRWVNIAYLGGKLEPGSRARPICTALLRRDQEMPGRLLIA
jgi:hypothetical protein